MVVVVLRWARPLGLLEEALGLGDLGPGLAVQVGVLGEVRQGRIGLVEQVVRLEEEPGHLLGERARGLRSAGASRSSGRCRSSSVGGASPKITASACLEGVADHHLALEVDDHLLEARHLGLVGGHVEGPHVHEARRRWEWP